VKVRLIAAASLVIVLGGCAAEPLDNVSEEKVYATGSNIPMRNRDVHVITPEGWENAKNSSSGNTGRKPGGGS
jgi:hypothetical protein